MKTNYLLAGLFVTLTLPLTGQNDQPNLSSASERTSVQTMLRHLSKGVLIVRLNSNDRKIKELERLVNSPGTNEKSKKRFRKMLDSTLAETRQESLDIMKAFDGNYNFSEVLFMYDTASFSLKEGAKNGFFLNRELETDKSIRLGNDSWLMIYFRHESPALFILLDSQNEPVQRPFPVPKRPVFRSYDQGQYFNNDAQASGFTLLMTYNKKKQYKYFSVLISNWNRNLQKALERLEKTGE